MYLQFHSVKELGLGSVWFFMGFGLGSCTFLTFGFRFCLVLGKTSVLVLFDQAGFGFFPSLVSGNNLQRISW